MEKLAFWAKVQSESSLRSMVTTRSPPHFFTITVTLHAKNVCLHNSISTLVVVKLNCREIEREMPMRRRNGPLT